MELLVVAVLGAGIGYLVRYLLPGRETYGVLLNPAVAACATMIVWVLMFINGAQLDAGWIWTLSLLAAVVVSVALPLVLRAARPRRDDERLRSLLSKQTTAKG